MVNKKKITIQDLHPDLSPEEQEEAEKSLREYAHLVWDIYQRVRLEDPKGLAKALKEARKSKD